MPFGLPLNHTWRDRENWKTCSLKSFKSSAMIWASFMEFMNQPAQLGRHPVRMLRDVCWSQAYAILKAHRQARKWLNADAFDGYLDGNFTALDGLLGKCLEFGIFASDADRDNFRTALREQLSLRSIQLTQDPARDYRFLNIEWMTIVPSTRHSTWKRCISCRSLRPTLLSDAAGTERCVQCGHDQHETIDIPAVLSDSSTDQQHFHARHRHMVKPTIEVCRSDSSLTAPLRSEEHSAQISEKFDDAVDYSTTEEYELLFQDIPVDDDQPIDVLSCTTTMEVALISVESRCSVANHPSSA